jgi:hypothetical protein
MTVRLMMASRPAEGSAFGSVVLGGLVRRRNSSCDYGVGPGVGLGWPSHVVART